MSRSLGGTSFTRTSPIMMSPDVASSRPATIRSAVVFPHPEGPTRTMNSLSLMSRLRLSTALTSLPKIFSIDLNATRANRALLWGLRADYNSGRTRIVDIGDRSAGVMEFWCFVGRSEGQLHHSKLRFRNPSVSSNRTLNDDNPDYRR